MNVKATLSPDDLARACAEAMWKEDDASKGLGMEIIEIGPGQATLTMTVKPHMVNGQRIAHGGFIFTLADSAFAFACNTHNERVVAAQGNISFIRPGKLGDRLVATAREISRNGRSGIYDVRVTVDDVVIAEFRGHSRSIGGTWLPAENRYRNKQHHDGETRDGFDEPAIGGKQLPRRAGRGRACLTRRDHGAADQAPRLVAGACLRQRRALPKSVRQRRRASVRLQGSLSDLAKFPFTIKTDLRDNYPFNMFAVPREKLVRVHASSGTTGKPIVVGYTRADIDMWSEVMARSIRAAGGRSGMIMHNAYGYGLFTGGLGRALRRRAARLHRGAGLRRHDRAAGATDQRLQARHHHGHAELHAGDPRRVQEARAWTRANRR